MGFVLGAEVQCHIERKQEGASRIGRSWKGRAIKSRKEAVDTGSGRKVESYSW